MKDLSCTYYVNSYINKLNDNKACKQYNMQQCSGVPELKYD